jgi:hypothetical protein
MAAAITGPTAPVGEPAAQVGKPMVVTGTGWAATHAATVTIEQLGVTINVTTDGSGNLTTAADATIVPQTDVPLDIVVNDGTSTVTTHIEVGTE